MANPMRGKTDHAVFENVIKELGGSGGMPPPPPENFEICIANGAL